MSAGKWPPDHSHVQSTTGWFVSDLWPSLPLLFPLHQALSPKQSKGVGEEKKELLLRMLHTAETRTSYLNCWLVLQGYWVHIRPFSQICSYVGPWRWTTMKYLVLLLKSNAVCLRQPVYVCLMHTARNVCMLHQRMTTISFTVSTHSHDGLSWRRECVSGPSSALGSRIYGHTKHYRAWEGKPVQTTGLHPSLTALFNELAAARRIPPPICTGPSGSSGSEPYPLN